MSRVAIGSQWQLLALLPEILKRAMHGCRMTMKHAGFIRSFNSAGLCERWKRCEKRSEREAKENRGRPGALYIPTGLRRASFLEEIHSFEVATSHDSKIYIARQLPSFIHLTPRPHNHPRGLHISSLGCFGGLLVGACSIS